MESRPDSYTYIAVNMACRRNRFSVEFGGGEDIRISWYSVKFEKTNRRHKEKEAKRKS